MNTLKRGKSLSLDSFSFSSAKSVTASSAVECLKRIRYVVGGKWSNNMNLSVVASNNHIIVDEPLAIFQP